MKNVIQLLLTLLILISMVSFLSCDTNTSLSDEEKEDLLQLREEEKLARDVYLYSYEKYGLSIFNNISDSEQTHMNRVLQILENYNLSDPAGSDTGVFNNQELQNLYNSLTARVDTSELEALLVGAEIEDLDIKDIQDFLQRTTKTDISNMYENLMCGSRNHLRSYYSQITTNGGSYSPKYISQSEFDSIITSDNENCG